MKRTNFIDKWVFRMVSPVITGTIVYLLILLLNNNIDQLLESFITDEYFICIFLALLVIEATRLILSQHERFFKGLAFLGALSSIALTLAFSIVVLVIIVMSCYFNSILGYQPNLSELQPFIILYIGLSTAYSSFYLSNFYLKKSLLSNLEEEEKLAGQANENFARMTRGINPNLLFESLESIITLLHKDKEAADNLIDHLSVVYRYTLSKNQQEIVPIADELYALDAFTGLLNQLPYRNIQINNNIHHNSSLVPGTLLKIVESIVKCTIARDDEYLNINLASKDDQIIVKYPPHDKLTSSLSLDKVQDISNSYRVFSNHEIIIRDQGPLREVIIPNLNIQN